MTKQKKVLIVDDDRAITHVLELKLQHEGYKTKVVESGQACLRLLNRQNFDAMLLDMMLPDGDGFWVLEQLKKKEHTLIIFALSNLNQAEDEEHALSLGAQQFFVKNSTQLSEIIDA